MALEKIYRGATLSRAFDFAEREGAAAINTDLALRSATQPADAQLAQWAVAWGWYVDVVFNPDGHPS